MVGSPGGCSGARYRVLVRPDRARAQLAGRTNEWVRRYSAGVGPASGGFLTPAPVAGFGAWFAGFGGGYVVQKCRLHVGHSQN